MLNWKLYNVVTYDVYVFIKIKSSSRSFNFFTFNFKNYEDEKLYFDEERKY